MEFSNGRIKFNRGDDDALMVALSDGSTFKDGDKVFFSLKTEPSDTDDILQIESEDRVPYNGVANAAMLVSITHEDTIEIDLGKYYYDIYVEWSDGTFRTVVEPIRFTLAPGGSHDEDETGDGA